MRIAMLLSEPTERWVKLQALNVLTTVVQAGSMGKAAQRLNNLSYQPAISGAISELQHALGCACLRDDGMLASLVAEYVQQNCNMTVTSRH
jgi:hypothetical protein